MSLSKVKTRDYPISDPRRGVNYIKPITLNSYTIANEDKGWILEVDSPNPTTLTIPALSVPIGSEIGIIRFGAGAVSIVADTGVTLYPASPSSIANQYETAVLYKLSATEWLIDLDSGGGGGGGGIGGGGTANQIAYFTGAATIGSLTTATYPSLTELSYVKGVTSSIQTQLNGKQATGNYITALTGEVTASGPGSVAATIANGAVTLAKMANLTANTIIGNNTAGAATPLALTGTQVTAMLDLFSTTATTKGLVPGSNSLGNTYFLRADGSWAVPAGGTTYTFSTGLTEAAGTVTANLSTGIAGGQIATGGTGASDNLTLRSTTNATKGKILFGTSAYDEANNRLGIGTASPTVPLEVNGTSLFSDDASFANGKGIILPIAGTNRSSKIYQISTTDNFSQINFYPSSGTNVGQSFSVSPKGTGYSTSIKSQFTVYNTDAISDPNNVEYITFRAGGTSFNINSGKLNTGVLRPIRLSAGYGDNTTNPDQLWLYITGNVGINTSSDAGFRLDVNGTLRAQGDFTISTKNIITDGTTGTKIGTGTTQKLSFWNAAPIAQPTTAVTAATLVGGGGTNITDTDTFDGYTLQQVVKALRNAGLLA